MLEDLTSVTLATALSGLSAQQRVTANNIANLETPNFTASTVSFSDSLRSAVAAGDPTQTIFAQAASGDAPGVNGNNVSLDTETINAEKSQLQYQLLSTAISNKFNLIDTAIKG
jgi:flagellar basal-body rod protein FlgB